MKREKKTNHSMMMKKHHNFCNMIENFSNDKISFTAPLVLEWWAMQHWTVKKPQHIESAHYTWPVVSNMTLIGTRYKQIAEWYPAKKVLEDNCHFYQSIPLVTIKNDKTEISIHENNIVHPAGTSQISD